MTTRTSAARRATKVTSVCATTMSLLLLGCLAGPVDRSPPTKDLSGALQTRQVVLDGQAIALPVLSVDGKLIFEGDIEVVASSRAHDGAVSSALLERSDGLWPGAVMPYEIADDLPNPDRIRTAMQNIEAVTPVRFVERSGQEDYVQFLRHETRCSARVGRDGGPQPVNLTDRCGVRSTTHEILHALGFKHEHSRYDRDSYVRIFFDNVQEDKRRWFEIVPPGFTQRGSYDLGSIMHYGSTFFAIDRTMPTITELDGTLITQAPRMSPSDIASINRRYEPVVPISAPPRSTTWTETTFVRAMTTVRMWRAWTKRIETRTG